MIGGHLAHYRRTEDALSIEFSTVEEHLPEPHIVTDGSKRAGATAIKLCICIKELDCLGLAGQRVIREGASKTRPLRLVGVERCIFHLQRTPNAGGEVITQALLGHLFDYRTKHI